MVFKFLLFSVLFITIPSVAESLDLNNDIVNAKKAEVVIIVNEGDRIAVNPEGQTLSLYKSGILLGVYNISTASNTVKYPTIGKKYIANTPHGFYRAKRVYNEYHSYTFYGANMKYAVFFNGGIAIHASEDIHKLGYRDSGGCIRLEESGAALINAAILSTGNITRDTVVEDFCNSKEENCHKRSLYINRIKLPNINSQTGAETSDLIWTYDTLIVIKPGN